MTLSCHFLDALSSNLKLHAWSRICDAFLIYSRHVKADVGVVVPTFNRPTETLRAINSVLQQTLPPSEIVIIDDGSSQDCADELRKLLNGLDVKLVWIEPSRHPGIARNQGIALLSSKWVAFLDSDDLWLPDKLEKQLAVAQKHKVMAICSNAYLDSNSKNVEFFNVKKSATFNLKSLLKKNLIINSSVLLDRSLLSEVQGVACSYSVRGVEDYATWLRIASRTNWFYIAEPLVVYESNSKDSLRLSNIFENRYNQINAILDFQSWSESKNRAKNFFVRIYLKGLAIFVLLDQHD
jgi:teichuronic acid biosynthesis glycosyltransferase TuaG